jgi:tetratricopeptide (TPR) repeat protein
MGYTTESSSIAENVLGVFPGYLPALNLIGLNALVKNDLNRAVRAFETSYNLQPHQKATVVKLSYSYTKFAQELRYRNFILQAYETEEKLFRLNPKSTETQLRMIVDQATMKNHVKAQEIFDNLPQNYHNPRKYYVHAKMHLNKNEVFAALEKIDEGLVIFPQEKVLLQFRESILKLQINSTKSP